MKIADFLQMRNRANDLLDTGDVWAVIRLYESVLAEILANSRNVKQPEIRCEAYCVLCDELMTVQAERFDLSQLCYAEALLVAEVYRSYGMVLCQNGRLDAGLDYLHQAHELAQKLKEQSLYLHVLYSLAQAEYLAGDHEMGYAYALRLQQLAEAHQSHDDLAKAYHALGLYQQMQGNAGKARRYWLKGVTIAKVTEQKMLLWQLHQLLADVAPSKAVRHLHRYMAADLMQKVAELIQDFDLKERFLHAASVKEILQAVFIAV